MKPWRKLDKQIAERVFGWKVIETDDCNGTDNYWLSKDGQNVFVGDLDDLALPEYSTDIKAAWEVVEKIKGMRGEDESFTIEWDRFGSEWSCGFYNFGECVDPSVSKTLPHAICLAALAAIGVEVPE